MHACMHTFIRGAAYDFMSYDFKMLLVCFDDVCSFFDFASMCSMLLGSALGFAGMRSMLLGCALDAA